MKERISTSEWKVMEVLWQEGAVRSSVVVSHLEATGWSDKTIKTMLSRLSKKGLIGHAKEGKYYIYSPVVRRGDCVVKESRDFMNKIFGGSGTAFVASLLKNETFTKDELEELRQLLEEKEKEIGK